MQSSTKDIEIQGLIPPARAAQLRWVGFLVICFVPLALGWDLTRIVSTLALANETFSATLVIPFVSVLLIYERRNKIFSVTSFGWFVGAALLVLGVACVSSARFDFFHLQLTNQAVLFVFGIILIWLGAFGLFFGGQAFRQARFPLLFLLFAVPIPEPFLSAIIRFLQTQSANCAEWFFRLAGVPYLRQGLIFGLPGVNIRVAEECSGIRSSLALLITVVLASHLFLRTTWRKLVMCAVVIPLAILKNGLRIAALSILAIYLNPGFLYGNLHHHGGIVFFMLAFVPIGLLLIWLQKTEGHLDRKTGQ